jgi:high-affinity nickel-transport protein
MLGDRAGRVRPKVIGLCAVLGSANLLAWLWAFASFHAHPLLLATCLIAYGLGLRHAVDADHIAAIDNVIRKLIHEGKQPLAVGLYFSLGHSTVVFVASLTIALTASSLQERFPRLIEVGSLIGTLVSVLFLFAIALINLVVLTEVCRLVRLLRRGQNPAGEGLDASGVFSPAFSVDRSSWFLAAGTCIRWAAVRARVRYGNGDRAARDLGRGSVQRIADLVDPGISRALHRWDVAG